MFSFALRNIFAFVNQGIQGPIGTTGVKGAQGSVGIRGYKGEHGDRGVTGDKGVKGIQVSWNTTIYQYSLIKSLTLYP